MLERSQLRKPTEGIVDKTLTTGGVEVAPAVFEILFGYPWLGRLRGRLYGGVPQRALLGVVIPPDYSRNILSGDSEAQVQLLLDGSDSNTAAIARGYAEGIVQTYAARLRSDAQSMRGGRIPPVGVSAESRVWYNPDMVSRNFIVPGLIAVIMMIITGNLSSLTIAREWENGTMEQLLSTPVRPSELALGKLAAYFGIVPRVSNSNETEHSGRITKRGTKLGRTTLVQRALIAQRYSPYLKAYYEKKKSRGTGKAIIALARKFLGIIYRTLKNKWLFEDFPNFVLAEDATA